jgi:hypothetical protein
MLACRCADCSDDLWGRISSVSVCGVATTSACVGDFACVCDSSRACPLPHNDQCPGHLHGWHFVHGCALISLAENTATLADMLVARATRHWCCQHNCSQCPVGAIETVQSTGWSLQLGYVQKQHCQILLRGSSLICVSQLIGTSHMYIGSCRLQVMPSPCSCSHGCYFL